MTGEHVRRDLVDEDYVILTYCNRSFCNSLFVIDHFLFFCNSLFVNGVIHLIEHFLFVIDHFCCLILYIL